MNQNYQFSGLENSQINFESQSSLGQAAEGSTANVSYVQSGSPDAMPVQFPQHQQTSQHTSVNTIVNSPIVQNNFVVDSPIQPILFFYRPPNEFCHYYVQCKEIPYDTIPCLLGRSIQFNDNEFIFFYRQQHNNQFYQVSCEIVPHLLINNCLNKNYLGIELQQDMGQEHLAFTFDRKIILEYHLKQYLSQYLLN